MDKVSKTTGYSFSLGYVSADEEFGLVSGPKSSPYGVGDLPQGNLTLNDTMALGSGTKTFTGAAIMRLVDQKKVNLDDLAKDHTDGPMKKMWNTTLQEIFGEPVNQLTVGHLIHMQSGLQDYDQPAYDYKVLVDESKAVIDPLEYMQFVANLTEKDGCETGNCTWAFEPGKHTMYSSTNFIVAGLVLLNHAPIGQRTWQTFNMADMLGLDTQNDYQNLLFPAQGQLKNMGLTTPGVDREFGNADIWEQDSSMMGWTCGNAVASSKDVAKFYWNLLGPQKTILSDEAVKNMTSWSMIDFGWDKGKLYYGGALMVTNMNLTYFKINQTASTNDLTAQWGHDGDTYGFLSSQGYFPNLNFSMSVTSNADIDDRLPYHVSCPAVEIIMKYQGHKNYDLGCFEATTPKFGCRRNFGEHYCDVVPDKEGTEYTKCEDSCKNEIAQLFMQ